MSCYTNKCRCNSSNSVPFLSNALLKEMVFKEMSFQFYNFEEGITYKNRVDKKVEAFAKFIEGGPDEIIEREVAGQINTLDYHLKHLNAIDKLVTQDSGVVTVNGHTRKTMAQIEIDAADSIYELKEEFNSTSKETIEEAISKLGFITIDSFELGATITQRNEALRHTSSGKLYRWAGDLPKVVPASSIPANSGGIGTNAWLEVSDTTLRQEILTGGLLTDTSVVVDGSLSQRTINRGLESIAELSTIENPKDGLRIYVKSYFPNLGMGGGWFVYDSSQAAVNDGGTIIDGWVREVNDVALMPAWFGVRTDGTDDPLNPNHELLQVAVDAGFKSFDFGGSNNSYQFNGQVGLKSQGFYTYSAYRFTADGANVEVKGTYAWLTTIGVKNNGGLGGTGLGYTGKVFISGFNFTGDCIDGVFDGDFLYNVLFAHNDCTKMKVISRSYKNKGGTYPNGYFQSVYLVCNQFNSCARILDGSKGFNLLVDANTFESCTSGIYIFGNSQPSLNNCRITNNVYEAGGIFLKLGDAIGGVITGNYLEANAQADAVTEKCQVYFVRGSGSQFLNYTISDNSFQLTASQRSDDDYQCFKFSGFENVRMSGVILTNNWSNGTLTKAVIINAEGNQGSLPNTPRTAASTFIDYLSTTKTLTSTNVTDGELDAFWFTLPANTIQRNTAMRVTLAVTGKTSGGVDLTRFFVHFNLYIVTLLLSGGARKPDELGVLFDEDSFKIIQQPQSMIIDTVAGTGYKPLFTAPVARLVSEGNKHTVKISGYSPVSYPNFGGVSTLTVYPTIETMNGNEQKNASGRYIQLYG